MRRYFTGVVLSSSGDLVKLEGYAFVLSSTSNRYERRPEKRVRVFSLSDAGHIINILPKSIELDELIYQFSSGKLFVVDRKGFQLELTEFGTGT